MYKGCFVTSDCACVLYKFLKYQLVISIILHLPKRLFYDVIGSKMSSERILEKYSIKLCKALPMDDPNFLVTLRSYNILPGDSRDKLEMQKIKVKKADYYIQNVIKTSAELYLPKLLQAMEQYYKENTDNTLQELLIHMIAEMNSKFSSYVVVYFKWYVFS